MKKFEYIYKDLKEKIERGIYPIGSFLPKEHDLAQHYSVSRETLRKAQAKLQDEGFIAKIHGKGAKVLDFKRLKISTQNIASFFELSKSHKEKTSTQILKHKKEFARDFFEHFSDIPKNEPGISIERLRILNNESVILDKDFFFSSVIKKDIPIKHLTHSLYQFLEKELKIKIGFAKKVITIEPPSNEIRLLLDLHQDTHVVVTRSKVYLDNTQLFQLHESFQRVDTFQLTDLARR